MKALSQSFKMIYKCIIMKLTTSAFLATFSLISHDPSSYSSFARKTFSEKIKESVLEIEKDVVKFLYRCLTQSGKSRGGVIFCVDLTWNDLSRDVEFQRRQLEN